MQIHRELYLFDFSHTHIMQYIIVLLAKQFGRIVQPEILEFHRFLLITKQLSAYGCQLIRDQYALEFISIAAFHVKIRVNPDQFSDLNVQTGFFLDLTYSSHLRCFPQFDRSSGKAPLMTVAATLQQHFALFVQNATTCVHEHDLFVPDFASDPAYIVHALPRLLVRYVKAIVLPSDRVFVNVFGDLFVILPVADDMVVERLLPNWLSNCF